ncbi:glyoxylase-like metal-dependent hydrolase (beta-lactamase superfamily II) [Murinocardiopsis flavida]|uniref:beta-lactamase n=1 Tax=Murinocardiopsis flavida TaxID=645275 RepID=A0A2P8CXP9_9ACTN|nr:MBL fold metallo-hydrolase [Murinocardiopsis flavida]PSK89696.1 glyoxylase-like metal-dependent hydrolase (beta-lactamase superfamily II) [Murinocardiopsis flavida]
MSARRITDRIWLVGSGTDPQAGTDPHDCHAYLLDGGTEAALVDCGTGLAHERLLANIEDTGCLDRLTTILVTHYHADHAGGAAALRAATGAEVRAAPEAVTALAAADEYTTQVAAARTAGIYPADYRLPGCADARPITGGTVLRVGGATVEVHDAPGHCDGHLCLLADIGGERALFSGDAVFAEGRVSIQPIPDCRPHAYARTCRALAELAPDALLPGHGAMAPTGGARHLDQARDHFARLTVPPNLGA